MHDHIVTGAQIVNEPPGLRHLQHSAELFRNLILVGRIGVFECRQQLVRLPACDFWAAVKFVKIGTEFLGL